MALKQWLLAGLLASTCLVPIAAAGPIENYSPVTAERLKNPEPGNIIAGPMTARDTARSIRSTPRM